MPYHVAWTYHARPAASWLGAILARDDVIAIETNPLSVTLTMAQGRIGPPETIGDEPASRFLYLYEENTRVAIHDEILFENVTELMQSGDDIEPEPEEITVVTICEAPYWNNQHEAENIGFMEQNGGILQPESPGTLIQRFQHVSLVRFNPIGQPVYVRNSTIVNQESPWFQEEDLCMIRPPEVPNYPISFWYPASDVSNPPDGHFAPSTIVTFVRYQYMAGSGEVYAVVQRQGSLFVIQSRFLYPARIPLQHGSHCLIHHRQPVAFWLSTTDPLSAQPDGALDPGTHVRFVQFYDDENFSVINHQNRNLIVPTTGLTLDTQIAVLRHSREGHPIAAWANPDANFPDPDINIPDGTLVESDLTSTFPGYTRIILDNHIWHVASNTLRQPGHAFQEEPPTRYDRLSDDD